MDANAVKAVFDYYKTKNPTDTVGFSIGSVQILGKWSLRVRLKTPNPMIVYGLGLGRGPSRLSPTGPTALAQSLADPKNDILAQKTVGTGPYMLDASRTVQGDHCTFVPNPYYYDKSRQKWGEIILKKITDANTMLAALRGGQVDVGFGDPSTAGAAAKAGFKVVVSRFNGVGGGATGLYFYDHGAIEPALADVRVRQAMNYAIDRKTIVAALYGKYGTPISTPNNGTPGVDRRYVNYYPYNPLKARALLAAAGYPDGFTITAHCYDTICTAGSTWDHLNQSVLKDLNAVGIKTKLIIDTGQAVTNRTASIDFLPLGFVPMLYWYPWTYKQPGNYWGDQHGWRDPNLDKLFYRSLRKPTAQAVVLWQQISAREVKQAYFIPIVGESWILYVSKRVGGVLPADRYTVEIPDWYPTGK
jgi:peptide/nickel transport system substrate-binding protein